MSAMQFLVFFIAFAEPSSADKITALETLSRLGVLGSPGASLACEMVFDNDPSVAGTASLVLKKLSPRIHADVLTIRTGKLVDKALAVERLGKPSVATRDALPAVKEFAAVIPRGYEAEIAVLLTFLSEIGDATDFHLDWAKQNAKSRVRSTCARSFVVIAKKNESRRDEAIKLLTSLLTDNDPKVRAVAAKASAELKAVGKPVLPTLKGLLLDKDGNVRAAAEAAVVKIEGDK